MKIIDCIILSPMDIIYIQSRLEWMGRSVNNIARKECQNIPSLDKDENRILIRQYIREIGYLLNDSRSKNDQ